MRVTDTRVSDRSIAMSMVATVSTIIVATLLLFPIHILAPGDHEKRSCGNALSADLVPWRAVADGGDAYFEQAFRGCTSGRVDRLAKVALVISVTILTLTLMSARRRREYPQQGDYD